MSGDLPKRRTMSLEEVTVFNMWEIPVIVEVLERLRGSLRWGSGQALARRRSDGLDFRWYMVLREGGGLPCPCSHVNRSRDGQEDRYGPVGHDEHDEPPQWGHSRW
jgi:hypothetical protein